MLNWQGSGGFSFDASVRIEAEDRAGIERLVRYCYRFPKPDIHGRAELLLTPLELLEALAKFVLPPPQPRPRGSAGSSCSLAYPTCCRSCVPPAAPR
jgi:hypothetical protein